MLPPFPEPPPPIPQTPPSAGSGWWHDFWNAFIANLGSGPFEQMMSDLIEGGGMRLLEAFIRFNFMIQSTVTRLLSKAVDESKQASEPFVTALAADAIGNYFGVPISIDDVKVRGGFEGNRALADRLGSLVMQGLFRGFGTPGPITPERGEENAQLMLGYALSAAITSTMEKSTIPPIVHEYLPGLGETGDMVVQALGLGRMTRQAMTPIIQQTVHEPLMQRLHALYLDALPTPELAAKLLYRDPSREAWFFDVLQRHGYSREMAAQLRVIYGKSMERADVASLVHAGMIDDVAAKAALVAAGYSPEFAATLSELIANDRVPGLLESIAQTGVAMYVARELETDGLTTVLDQAGYSQREKELTIALCDLRRARPKHPATADVETGYVQDVLTLDQLHAHYLVEGYTVDDAQWLEQIATKRKLVYEQAQRKLPPPLAAGAGQRLSKADADEMLMRGIITAEQLTGFLTELGYKDPELPLLVQDAVAKRDAYRAKLARGQIVGAGLKAKTGTIEEAFVRGLVTEQELASFYVSVGYSSTVIPLLIELRLAEKADHDKAANKIKAQAVVPVPRTTN